jgi:hypothetical protein
MVKTTTPILIAALLMFTATAFADDSPSAAPVKSPKQRMQACVAKVRQANPSMSKEDSKKQCAQVTQSQDNHPSVPPSENPPHP